MRPSNRRRPAYPPSVALTLPRTDAKIAPLPGFSPGVFLRIARIRRSMNAATTPRVRAPEVMVSYSSQDRERVMQFVRALRASGVAVWIDQGGIDGAQRWSEEIVNAIEACRTVLLFISRTSMESQNIAKEVALAWEGGKDFLPLALEEAKIPKSMQYQLAGIQYVKLYEGDPDAKFESVLRALVRLGVRVSPYSMAVVSAGIGDRDQAIEWLAKACDERSAGLARLKGEPRFNFLQNDPRFVELAKRAESLALELADPTSEIVLPQPLQQTAQQRAAAPTGPVPAWKRLLWPDMADAKSARDAAALAVWSAAAIIILRWIVSFIVPTNIFTAAAWWDDPIVITIIWGAIGFGVQKMSRPAAMIGAGLCILGAWFNLNMLSIYKGQMEAQALTERMGQTYYGPRGSGLYYGSLFGVCAGIVFVIAFINAARGTLAYRQMVASGRTEDKQDALNAQDLLSARRKGMSLVQRVWGVMPRTTAAADAETSESAPPPMREPATPQPTAAATEAAVPALAQMLPKVPESQPVVAESTIPIPAEASKVAEAKAVDHLPTLDDAPEVHTLTDLIGAAPFRPMRALAFLTANIVAGLAFVLARVLLSPAPVHPVYWQFALLKAAALTLSALIAFGILRGARPVKGILASIIAATLTTAAIVAIAHYTLASFTIGDVVYREQFQEFVLIPFVDIFLTLFGLAYAVPRLRPLALSLFAGPLAAEILTSLLIAILHDLGAGAAPDPVLASTLVFFIGVRSAIFAAVFWLGLKLSGIGSLKAT